MDPISTEVCNILIETCQGFWIANTAFYFCFVALSFFVVNRIDQSLSRKNRYQISIFNIVFFMRAVMYSILYFVISNFGKMIITSDSTENEDHSNILVLYVLRLINNLFDFILITVFYLFLLFVKNFWDIIFMNKIGEIYSANYEFS